MLKKTYYKARMHIQQSLENRKALPESSPILVYSMRKVGSTTLTSTLRSEGHTVYKHHCIDPALNHELRMASSRAGVAPQHWLTDGANFRKRLDRWRTQREIARHEGRLKIFTFVKDPLSVALSDFFMQLFEFMPRVVSSKGLDSVDSLKDYFQTVLQATVDGGAPDPLTDYLGKLAAMPGYWFERELKTTTDIDVLNTPFPVNAGYGVYHGHDSDVVMIRTDRLSAVALDAIASLTGTRPAALIEKNVRAATPHGDLYRSLVENLSLPQTLVRAFYRQPWLNHFYSKMEIENMIGRWSRTQ